MNNKFTLKDMKNQVLTILFCRFLVIFRHNKRDWPPKEQSPKKNKKGLASVILAPIRLNRTGD